MRILEKEELEKFQELNKNFNTLKSVLADNAINLKRLETTKENIFRDLEHTSVEFKKLEESFIEKYGQITINIETGEIKDVEN